MNASNSTSADAASGKEHNSIRPSGRDKESSVNNSDDKITALARKLMSVGRALHGIADQASQNERAVQRRIHRLIVPRHEGQLVIGVVGFAWDLDARRS